MAYLKFNKEELVNLEYSLDREILLSNRAGGYVNTTIVGCNTRKYHGLLVVPIEKFGNEKHILLSTIHESLIQHGQSFNLGINYYGDVYEPRGHKYIVDFEMDYASTITYNVGGMKFSKTILFVRSSEEVLIKYTLLDAHSETVLRIKPFLAFRNIHALTSANTDANTKFIPVKNGVAFKMYEGFPTLNLQLDKSNEWIASPDWYKNIVYKEETRRGFADREDLFVPGYFELPIKKGESIILSASTQSVAPSNMAKKFSDEIKKRDGSRSSYESCLKLAANQFVIKTEGNYEICSGYTWDYEDLRSTFISAPGLLLYGNDKVDRFEKVIDCALVKLWDVIKKGESPDVPLWFIRTLQQYMEYGAQAQEVYLKYGKAVVNILDKYFSGESTNAQIRPNGMLWTKANGKALSWMNVYNKGLPITERGGYQVETNALWYNALMFAYNMPLKQSKEVIRKKNKWYDTACRIKDNFYNYFWIEERQHLADYIDDDGVNAFTRPNQIVACAVKYSPLSDDVKMKVLKSVKKELLTARGIRTLSPKNPLYKGVYEGNQECRDLAHHNGCAFPGLLGMYVEAMSTLVGDEFRQKGIELLNAFEEDMTMHGIGSIAELYDGNPAHRPHGCISSAISVAEIIRMKSILNKRRK